MAPSLDEALEYNQSLFDFVLEQLSGTHFPSDAKYNLIYAYSDIVLEYTEAIRELVHMKLYGAALATARPQVEGIFRCLWVLNCANPAQIEAIGQRGEEPFPRFRDLAVVLDQAYAADGYFAQIATNWTTLNGFTHTGLEQLGMRLRGDGSIGHIGPNYPDELIARLLQFTATTLIALFDPVFRVTGFPEKSEALNKWLDAYVRSH